MFHFAITLFPMHLIVLYILVSAVLNSLLTKTGHRLHSVSPLVQNPSRSAIYNSERLIQLPKVILPVSN